MANKTDMGPNQLVFIINIDALLCQGIIWTTWWYNTPFYCVSLSSTETSWSVPWSCHECWSMLEGDPAQQSQFCHFGAQTHRCFANGGDKTRSLRNTWWNGSPHHHFWWVYVKMEWEILLVQNTINEQMACKSRYGHWVFPLLGKVAYFCFQTEKISAASTTNTSANLRHN